MYNIQTYNQISPLGLNKLEPELFNVSDSHQQANGIILRSHKLLAEECASDLLAIARAGAGTNNVPVDHCTQQGTVVFNTPGANANAVKELVITALLLGCRGIAEGMQYVSQMDPSQDKAVFNKDVEAQKKRFKGVELKGKTLGVIGLGAIGANVASCCLELGMNVLGYDPAISVDAAWRLPSAVTKMESLEALLKEADFITLHVPAIPSTIGLINEESLHKVKQGAVLVNFARNEIVDVQAISGALEAGIVSKYISDFPVAELLNHPKVLLMPHLGASTQEAENNCAVMAADQMRDFLLHGNIKNSVNFPNTALSLSTGHRITFCNQNVPGVLGDVMSILADEKINVADMINKSHDNIAYSILDIESPLSDAVKARIEAIDAVIKMRYIETATRG
ncbi:phosphoglycerate dehydrogenase [Thaumasiovibrio subtropicus]|uniref:phosphoglycerate dehydrogenase n=1 Tax=Thaumasiovibrio subtropicus TaxID=1891207 RepID=UPI000B359478|nr:phosphoglycerate dehydrogenase [Thaumasiovibrio subtropicus]